MAVSRGGEGGGSGHRVRGCPLQGHARIRRLPRARLALARRRRAPSNSELRPGPAL